MKKEEDKKLYAFLAVLLSVIGFVVAYSIKKNDKYVMFYAKQSLVLFIFGIIAWVVAAILGVLTFGIGMIIFIPIVQILWLILWIIQIVNSLSGKEKLTPVIGEFAKKINL